MKIPHNVLSYLANTQANQTKKQRNKQHSGENSTCQKWKR